jgi:hypothetical protein
MNSLACALTLLLAAPQALGGVSSTYDKKFDFTTLKTYVWNEGHVVQNPVAHKLIVESIESQMASLGFKKVESGPADVILKYHSLRSADVDLKAVEKAQREGQKEPVPTTLIGSLVVVIYPSKSVETPLWQARTRRPFSDDTATRIKELQAAVAALFDTYPLRKAKTSK